MELDCAIRVDDSSQSSLEALLLQKCKSEPGETQSQHIVTKQSTPQVKEDTQHESYVCVKARRPKAI